MTREQVCKYKLRAYMEIDYVYLHSKERVSCMLISVDFDNEIFGLRVFPGQTSPDGEIEYTERDFVTHISFCELPQIKSQLKLIKK